MSKSKHTEAQIIAALKQVEAGTRDRRCGSGVWSLQAHRSVGCGLDLGCVAETEDSLCPIYVRSCWKSWIVATTPRPPFALTVCSNSECFGRPKLSLMKIV